MRRLVIYSLLALGSAVFVWPFVWMASTSAKLERELFRERPHILPQSPKPRLQSPYIDNRLFADVSGPRMDKALPMIEAQLTSPNYDWPADVDRNIVIKETARGIYAHLLTTIPREHWDLSTKE